MSDYPAVLLLLTLHSADRAMPPANLPLAKIESWWTGKDSNLRSPQGAADLQSAGFSHSPTRPGKPAPGYQIRIREASGRIAMLCTGARF